MVSTNQKALFPSGYFVQFLCPSRTREPRQSSFVEWIGNRSSSYKKNKRVSGRRGNPKGIKLIHWGILKEDDPPKSVHGPLNRNTLKATFDPSTTINKQLKFILIMYCYKRHSCLTCARVVFSPNPCNLTMAKSWSKA